MSDLISRQAALNAIERLILPQTKGETAAEEINRVAWRCAINCAEEMIGHLPPIEPTLYGYKLHHLAFVARLLQNKGVTEENLEDVLNSVDWIVGLVLEEERKTMDEGNTETLEAWDFDGSPTRYIRGQREDKAQDCETCKNRKTCKDAPIPSCYACLGYRPVEEST